MKKTLLAIVAAFMVAGVASAQKLMTIALNNGETITVNTSKVKDITFKEIPPFYVGTWKVKSFFFTKETLDEAWFGMIPSWEGYPEYYPGDTFEFTADGKLKTNLGSTLANYFYEESNYVVDTTLPKVELHINNSMTNIVVPTILSLDNVNRFFSDKEESEDKQAYLGVAPNEEDDSLLDIFILDYYSKSFGYPDLDKWFVYNNEKPLATTSNLFVHFTLERVK